MREIKFRGKTPKGEIVYGDLNQMGRHVYIDDWCVEKDSVAQLCGLDSNGDEVYEGDTVASQGKEYTARLLPVYGVFQNFNSCVKKK